jgi:streptogramin lyase
MAAALAAALVLAVVVAGGLRWGGEEPVSHPKVTADFPLADNLGTISSGFGSVWVADTKQLEVLRVDPRTHQVTARIKTGGDTNAFNGDPIVNAGAGAVWAIARAPGTDGGSHVLRIDPQTNRVTARVPLPARQAPIVGDIQIVDGVPWVLTSRGAIELDPTNARPRGFVSNHMPAGEPFPLWSFVTEKELWFLTRNRTIERFDLRDGRRTGTDRVPVAGAVAVVPTDAGRLYSLQNAGLALASADGKVRWRRQVGTNTTIPLVLGGMVWTHASDTAQGRDRLVELDLRTGKPRSSTGLPQFGIAGLTPVSDDLWISTPSGRVMIVRP